MGMEVDFQAPGNDAPKEPSSPPAEPTSYSPAEEKDAPEDYSDVQPAEPVPSVYCAAITPTQCAALRYYSQGTVDGARSIFIGQEGDRTLKASLEDEGSHIAIRAFMCLRKKSQGKLAA